MHGRTELPIPYASGGGSWRYAAEPDPAAYPGISRAFGLLRELARETEDLPADVLVREVLARSGLLPLVGFAYEGAQRVANLRKLAAAAADLARDGTLSLNEVLDALESERAGAVEGDSPLAGEGHEAVRVLTVHKAKGLESRIVLVADLAREGRRGGPSPDEDVNVAALPGGGAALALKGAKLRNSARVWLEREAREALDAFAASPLAEKLRSVDVLGQEVPVLLREEDGTTVSGFLDLLYRDADGNVVVADCKTDRALAAEEAEKLYGAQLGAYAETARRALRLPAPPRTELWLVRRGEILLVRAGSE